ncbi:hypothetical protein [Streptomyces sp. NPDC058299]|uniref:hypothetical protein n=1 Tax=unclassified Streptomyces TaxID=2593676 RepID=UPI0036E1E70B
MDAPPSFTGPEDFRTAVAAAVDDYRVDRQAGQPIRLELWCETAGMVPQLVRIGAEFGIACFSGGGFDGLAGKHEAAVRALSGGRRTRILHLGDYDQSGVHMFSSLAEDVIAFAEAAGAEVEFERVAVTPEQIAAYNLPTAPPKATDRRSFSGPATTQAEALPPTSWLCSFARPSRSTATRKPISGPLPVKKPNDRRSDHACGTGRPEQGDHTRGPIQRLCGTCCPAVR